MIYIRIDYEKENRVRNNPGIEICETEKEADMFIDICKRFGIGIVACKKILKEEAEKINPGEVKQLLKMKRR